MTEQEWLHAADPGDTLAAVRENVSERKLRLFACACARRIWSRMPDDRCRRAIETGEQFADNGVTEGERREVHEAVNVVLAETWNRWGMSAEHHVAGAAWFCVTGKGIFAFAAANRAMSSFAETERKGEMAVQAEIFRDILGNPFRPVTPQVSWLTWNGGSIVKVAEAAYQERALPSGHLDNARLAVLADILEESGCSNSELLGHLRDKDAVHVRGCWVVDLLLGKT